MKLKLITTKAEPELLIKVEQTKDGINIRAVNSKGEHLKFLAALNSEGLVLFGGASGIGIDTDDFGQIRVKRA